MAARVSSLRGRSVTGLPSACRCSPRIPRASWTPADPRGSHHSDPSGSASGAFTPSPAAFCPLTGRSPALGRAVFPAVDGVSWVRFSGVVRRPAASSTAATRGRSGWFDLPPQGRAPCQKRQAALGALTHEAQRRAGEQARIFDSSDDLQAARCPARPLQCVIRSRPVRSGDISNR